MKVFAISDLHLSGVNEKPMDVFGKHWENYWQNIKNNWSARVSQDDAVIIAGDISWAMKAEDAFVDINDIAALPGKKIFIKGNHDYWWNSVTQVRRAMPQNCYVIQNDAVKLDNVVFCGTRGWLLPGNKAFTGDDRKIYARELMRLQMSISSALRVLNDGDKLVIITHFPPFEEEGKSTEVTETISGYKTNAVVFGHVHGRTKPQNYHVPTFDGIPYYLTTCDFLGFDLTEILL